VNSVTNAVYTLQFKDDIAAASWSSLTDVPGTGSMLTFEDTTGGGARFYRVQAH
jgi:hypothetical protein